MRKKALSCVFIALILCLLLSCTAFAAGEDAAGLGHVTDAAGILTAEQVSALETRAAEIAAEYECGIYIVTVDDYQSYTRGSVYDCAKEIYKSYTLGWGSEQDGVMLLLSMDDRDYTLIEYGGFGNAAFTDYGKDRLADEFLDNFRRDDWYGGFADYLEFSAEMMSSARDGSPLDVSNRGSSSSGYGDSSIGLVFVILIPLFIAFVVCTILKSQMKTAKLKQTAHEYVARGGFDLRIREDVFTHRTETREIIEDRSSSGGGTSVGSDGFSGKSGKF